VPPTDFEMSIGDGAAPKSPVVAEPTKLRPMSLTRRAGE